MKNISKGTIIRTIILIIALINVGLEMTDHSILPISDDLISEVVSYLFAAGASIAAWWKNNSFTKGAIAADEALHDSKAEVFEEVAEDDITTEEEAE